MKLQMLAIATLTTALIHSARAQEPAAEPAEPAAAAPATAAAPLPMPAAGGSPTAFGAVGQLVLSADLPIMQSSPQFAIVHETVSMGGQSATLVDIAPSIDYFVIPNLSIGALLGIEYGSLDANGTTLPTGATVTEISVEGRVGYNIPLGDGISIWPRLGIGYQHISVSNDGMTASSYVIPLSITVPVLWHPGDHFFVGAGPAFLTQLVYKAEGNDQPKTTDYGITALIGGTIGG